MPKTKPTRKPPAVKPMRVRHVCKLCRLKARATAACRHPTYTVLKP